MVTGGTSGIGRAIAQRFAEAGDRVIICGRNVEAGTSLARNIGNIVFYRCDLSIEDDIDRLVQDVYRDYGGIDILVNNAGVLILKPLEEMSYEDFIYTYKVNLFAPFLLMKKIVPMMASNGGGVVINISSIAGISPYPRGSAYCSSKAALISLSRSLALEYARRNVRIVVVAPGLIRTPMAFKDPNDMDEVERASKAIPAGYVADPEEVAELVYYLASDKARYITGSVHVIDGGVTSGRFKSLVDEE